MTAPPLETPAADAVHREVPSARTPSARVHMPALDGVRGLAILMVVLTHTVGHLNGTHPVDSMVRRVGLVLWAGVDLFFVLSGFLITSVLLGARGKPHYFRNFIGRRALRIIPLYVVVLLLVMAVLPAFGLLDPTAVATMRANLPWFATFATNILVALRDWDQTGYLGHLWSIAVEEQFYILWPLFAALLVPPRFRVLSLALVVGAPLIRVAFAAAGATPAGIFTLMPTRVDGLAMGAFLACTLRALRGDTTRVRAFVRRYDLAALVALVPLVLIFVRQGTVAWGFRSTQLVGYTALAVVGGWLVLRAAVAEPGGTIYRAFGGGVLPVFGKYSYSMYLFHTLVIDGFEAYGLRLDALPKAAGMQWPASLGVAAVVTTAALGIAIVTWYALERPALGLKRYLPE